MIMSGLSDSNMIKYLIGIFRRENQRDNDTPSELQEFSQVSLIHCGFLQRPSMQAQDLSALHSFFSKENSDSMSTRYLDII